MGWVSGSDLATEIIKAFEVFSEFDTRDVSVKMKVEFYKAIITALEQHDWDTQDEAMGMSPEFDAAIRELNPAMFEDD